jgi:uncharacterized protein (DUF1015 family)
MAEIRPFRGLRYQAEAGPLEKLIALPADILTPDARQSYANSSEFNIVHLASPIGDADDRSKFVKYSQCAANLAQLRRAKMLEADGTPTLYRLRQYFTDPAETEPVVRTTIIALVYLDSSVVPTEVSIPAERENRLRLLEATRAQLEAPTGLYEDPEGRITDWLNRCELGSRVQVLGDDGVEHRLEPITDAEQIRTLQSLFADKTIYIIESQSLYESAAAFQGTQPGHEVRIPEDFLLVQLTAISDPGLVALARHWLVANWTLSSSEVTEKLSPWFDIHATHSRNVLPMMRHANSRGGQAFGIAFEGGKGFLLVRKGEHDDRSDVETLRELVLREGLGFSGREAVTYSQDESEALRMVNESRGIAFFLNPPREQDLGAPAKQGKLRPTQSTYLFPKVPSGLVMWSLNDWV